MSKLRRLSKALAAKNQLATERSRWMHVVWMLPSVVLVLSLGAYGANELLRGHVSITQPQAENVTGKPGAHNVVEQPPILPPSRSASVQSATASSLKVENLVDKYGAAASSRAVAAAIRNVLSIPGFKEASDRYEALEHGYWRPGDDPMTVIMHGYVPPGMPPQQAAILYNTLPNNVKTPRVLEPGTPERIARMANEPMDPETGLPLNFKEQQIQAANQKMLEGYMRGRFGPISILPLHQDHNAVSQPATKLANGTVRQKDNQMSLIQAQYGYDGGNGPASIREMTDSSGNIQAEYSYDPYGRVTKLQGSLSSDFQYAGYYYHAPSGLNLAVHRAYSPTLGRWLSRDPVDDRTFAIGPRSPEPTSPSPGRLTLPKLPTTPGIISSSFHLGKPHAANQYFYVLNDPVKFADPSGLMVCPDYGQCVERCLLECDDDLAWLLRCLQDCASGQGGGPGS